MAAKVNHIGPTPYTYDASRESDSDEHLPRFPGLSVVHLPRHMSLAALVRFGADFGLFPHKAAAETPLSWADRIGGSVQQALHWLYVWCCRTRRSL